MTYGPEGCYIGFTSNLYLQCLHVLFVHRRQHEDIFEVRPALLAPQRLELLFVQCRVWLTATLGLCDVLIKQQL